MGKFYLFIIKYFVFPIFLFPIITSCTKETELPVNSGVINPIIDKGSVGGYIRLYTEYGDTNDYTGITVSIDGTSHITTTDSVGNWMINGVETGNKNLTFNKSGFSPFKETGVSISKNHTTYLSYISLYKKPQFYVSNLNAQLLAGKIRLTGYISSSPRNYWWAHFFVSSDSNVMNTLSNFMYHNYTAYPTYVYNFTRDISISEIYNAGITSGTKIYIIAYSDYAEQKYYDNTLKKDIYTSLSDVSSNKVSLVLP